MMATLLEDPDMCGDGNVPAFFKYGTAELPFGPVLNFLFTCAAIMFSPGNFIWVAISAMLSGSTYKELKKKEKMKKRQS